MAGDRAAGPPLVAHVVFRLDMGGLENGLVNLINRIPEGRYRHAVISLTEVAEFSRRVRRPDVRFYALHKREGVGLATHFKLWRLLRRLRPAVVHTRNLAALETQPAAWLAGVPFRVHGEHGRDVGDLDGENRRYQGLRRLLRPFVSHYIPLSGDLEHYLRARIGVPASRITHIYNGVDAACFHPAAAGAGSLTALGAPDWGPGRCVVGTVGRMQAVKDQLTLVRAFLRALTLRPDARRFLRLVLVGDGPLRAAAEGLLTDAGARDLAWLPGGRDDVPEVLRGLDVFVLPSLAEGVSNTILEAMATGLPVVATRVGGNPELVGEGVTGQLVPAADPDAMAQALLAYADDPDARRAHGAGGRARVLREFSMEAMVENYLRVYDRHRAPCAAGLAGSARSASTGTEG